jgi:hypothetical protein
VIPPQPAVPAPCIFYARGPRVRRAPGLPCALCFSEGEVCCNTRAQCASREGAFTCPPLVMPRACGASSTRRPLSEALRSLEYWVARSRLRQGYDEAPSSRARRSFSEGGKLGDDSGASCLKIESEAKGRFVANRAHARLATATASSDIMMTEVTSCSDVSGRARQRATFSLKASVASKKAGS